MLGEELQGVDGQLVVGLVEDAAAAVGEREHLGRAATAAVTVGTLFPSLHEVLGQ